VLPAFPRHLSVSEDYFDYDFLGIRHPDFDEYQSPRDLKANQVLTTIGAWEGYGVHLLGNLQGHANPA
jgi:hypothetical protein